MSKIIRAIVTTNSSEDSLARVKIKADGAWNETPLIETIGGIPLKKDDVVYVDVSDGFEAPIIIGRSFDKSVSFSKQVNGSLLFESSNGSDWTICFVKNNKFEFYNSNNTSIVVDGQNIVINGGSLGGLINIDDLVTKLNEFVSSFKNHKHTIQGTVADPVSGVLTFTQTSCTSPTASSFDKNDFEDTKVKH